MNYSGISPSSSTSSQVVGIRVDNHASDRSIPILGLVELPFRMANPVLIGRSVASDDDHDLVVAVVKDPCDQRHRGT